MQIKNVKSKRFNIQLFMPFFAAFFNKTTHFSIKKHG